MMTNFSIRDYLSQIFCLAEKWMNHYHHNCTSYSRASHRRKRDRYRPYSEREMFRFRDDDFRELLFLDRATTDLNVKDA